LGGWKSREKKGMEGKEVERRPPHQTPGKQIESGGTRKEAAEFKSQNKVPVQQETNPLVNAPKKLGRGGWETAPWTIVKWKIEREGVSSPASEKKPSWAACVTRYGEGGNARVLTTNEPCKNARTSNRQPHVGGNKKKDTGGGERVGNLKFFQTGTVGGDSLVHDKIRNFLHKLKEMHHVDRGRDRV